MVPLVPLQERPRSGGDRPSRRGGCSQGVLLAPSRGILCVGRSRSLWFILCFCDFTPVSPLGKESREHWAQRSGHCGKHAHCLRGCGSKGATQPRNEGPAAPPACRAGAQRGAQRGRSEGRLRGDRFPSSGKLSRTERVPPALSKALLAGVHCTCRGPDRSLGVRHTEKLWEGRPPPGSVSTRNQDPLWRLEVPAEPQAVPVPCALALRPGWPVGREPDSSHDGQ